MTVEEARNMFDQINRDAPEESVPLAAANVEYYAEQLWNITNEGDLTEAECLRIAQEICVD